MLMKIIVNLLAVRYDFGKTLVASFLGYFGLSQIETKDDPLGCQTVLEKCGQRTYKSIKGLLRK